MKRQQRTRSAPHPLQLHEEAFDLYCAGLSCPQVGEALRERYGADAPHNNTLKRWMVRDCWPSRRQAIREHTALLNDRLRAAEDTRLIASLTGLRDTLVAAGSDLPFRSAEGAVFSLAALQKVIDRLSKAAAGESDCFSQEDLDMVMETFFQVLWEDEEVAPVLDRRMSQILDIIDSRLNDQPVRHPDGPDGQVKGMGRPCAPLPPAPVPRPLSGTVGRSRYYRGLLGLSREYRARPCPAGRTSRFA